MALVLGGVPQLDSDFTKTHIINQAGNFDSVAADSGLYIFESEETIAGEIYKPGDSAHKKDGKWFRARSSVQPSSGSSLTDAQLANINLVSVLVAGTPHIVFKVAGYSNGDDVSVAAYVQATPPEERSGARAVRINGFPIIYDWNTNQVIVGGNSGVAAGVGTEASVQTGDGSLLLIRYSGGAWVEIPVGSDAKAVFLGSPEITHDDYEEGLYSLHASMGGGWVAVKYNPVSLDSERRSGGVSNKPANVSALQALFNN